MAPTVSCPRPAPCRDHECCHGRGSCTPRVSRGRAAATQSEDRAPGLPSHGCHPPLCSNSHGASCTLSQTPCAPTTEDPKSLAGPHKALTAALPSTPLASPGTSSLPPQPSPLHSSPRLNVAQHWSTPSALGLLFSPLLFALPPNKFPPVFPPPPRPPLFLHSALPLSRLVSNARSKDCRPAAVECPRETTHSANTPLRCVSKTCAACARAANTRATCALIVLVLVPGKSIISDRLLIFTEYLANRT